MTASLSAPDEQYDDGPRNGPVPVDAGPDADREERALQAVPPPVEDAAGSDSPATGPKRPAPRSSSAAKKPTAKRTTKSSGAKPAAKTAPKSGGSGSKATGTKRAAKPAAAKSPRSPAKKSPPGTAAAQPPSTDTVHEDDDGSKRIVDRAGSEIVVPPKPPLPPEPVAGAADQGTAPDEAPAEAATAPGTEESEAATPPPGTEESAPQPEAAAPPIFRHPPRTAEPRDQDSAEGTEPETSPEPEPDSAEGTGEQIEAPEPPPLPIGGAIEFVPTIALLPDGTDIGAAPDASDADAVGVAESKPFHKPSKHPEIDPDAPALSLRGVVKAFGGTRAVDGIDLTVPAGTFYGMVGPNGAGKTTTLSMIAGLLRPDRGRIEICGVDAAAAPRVAKRMMGVLPDRLRTFDRLTGRQLLYYYGTLRGLRPAVVESRTADLARAFDLRDALGRVVGDYSAGMTKKVMLAGAMIHSPRLLVLDEPFEAVDPASSATILEILGTYVSHGGTVVLSSHGMELIEKVCSRVAVLVAGQALAEGTVEEVRGELTLEQRFVELAGGLSDVEGLEWLHTFSG